MQQQKGKEMQSEQTTVDHPSISFLLSFSPSLPSFSPFPPFLLSLLLTRPHRIRRGTVARVGHHGQRVRRRTDGVGAVEQDVQLKLTGDQWHVRAVVAVKKKGRERREGEGGERRNDRRGQKNRRGGWAFCRWSRRTIKNSTR